MLVTAPFVLLLLDLWPLAAGAPGTGRAPGRARRREAAAAGAQRASSVVTYFAQRSGDAVQDWLGYTFAVRLSNALDASLAYITRTLWPARLAFYYPTR